MKRILAVAFVAGLLAGAARGRPAKAYISSPPPPIGGGGGGYAGCPGGRAPLCVQCKGTGCVAACYGDFSCDLRPGGCIFQPSACST